MAILFKVYIPDVLKSISTSPILQKKIIINSLEFQQIYVVEQFLSNFFMESEEVKIKKAIEYIVSMDHSLINS